MSSSSKKPRLQLRRKVYKNVVMFENEVEEIEKMGTREDDIWVCSFPRSGTTLTQELVLLIETRDFEKATRYQLDEIFPLIDVKDERFPYYKGIKYVEEMESPRLIKCHLHHFMLPEQLRAGKGRIIYIARNPKDLVTSFYRLMQWGDQLEEGDKTFQQFVDAFVDGKGFLCPWPRHVLEFWNRRNDKNVLFLRYEDVIKDMPAAVREIAAFLNKSITEQEVAKICEYCHIDTMKSNNMCNMSYLRDVKYVNDKSEGGFMNKGKTGVWREVLSVDMCAKIDELTRQLEGSGLVLEDT